MCGVCGFIAPHSTQEWRYDALAGLLYESEERGEDATGVAFIDPSTGKTVIVKEGEKASEFVHTKKFQDLYGKLPSIVMGHTRGASVGGYGQGITLASPKDNKNNHPFYSKQTGLSLIHNGRIDDEMWRDTVGTEGGIIHPCDGETDSEVWLRVLESFQMRKGGDLLKNMVNTGFNVAGKYVIVVLSEETPDSIYFCVHDNPLVFGYLETEKAMVFASTEKIVENAMAEYRRVLFFDIKQNPITSVATISDNHVMKISLHGKESKPKYQLQKFRPATDKYEAHVKLAKKLADEKKEQETQEERQAITAESEE